MFVYLEKPLREELRLERVEEEVLGAGEARRGRPVGEGDPQRPVAEEHCEEQNTTETVALR